MTSFSLTLIVWENIYYRTATIYKERTKTVTPAQMLTVRTIKEVSPSDSS